MTAKPSKGSGTRNAQQRELRGKQPSAAKKQSAGPRPVTPQVRRTAAGQNRSAGARPAAPQSRRTAAGQIRSAAAGQDRSAGARPAAPQSKRTAAGQTRSANRSARPRTAAMGPRAAASRVRLAGTSKVRAVYPERVKQKNASESRGILSSLRYPVRAGRRQSRTEDGRTAMFSALPYFWFYTVSR